MSFHPPFCKQCQDWHYASDCCSDCGGCEHCEEVKCERCGKDTPPRTSLEGAGFLCQTCTTDIELEILK